jgi:hypothetical protein
VTCDTPPPATCLDGLTLRTFDASGACAGGQCSYTSHDTFCGSGCANGRCTDPCDGVVCTNPPAPRCDGDSLVTFASPGSCVLGSCSYAPTPTSCALGCQDATCFNPDPRLDDPARVSLPFECQGTPLDAAQVIEHIAQGDDSIQVRNGDREFGQFVFHVFRTTRRCQPFTGCSDYVPDTFNQDRYLIALFATTAGDLQLMEDPQDGSGWRTVAALGISDAQVLLHHNPSTGGRLRQYKLRITREDDGRACVSFAGESGQDPPVSDGSHLEWFWFGTTDLLAPVPRTSPPPLEPFPDECHGTAASSAMIGTWFAPGDTRLIFTADQSTVRSMIQTCHPITGCTDWTGLPFFRELFGLQTTSLGFAMRLDFDVSLPLVDGAVDTTLPTGRYTGLVTTDKCVSYDQTRMLIFPSSGLPPTAAVSTIRTSEHNSAVNASSQLTPRRVR